MVVKIKFLLLNFDLEEFDLVSENQNKISVDGALRILKILDKESVKSTFFTTVKFANDNKGLIKKIAKKHEIALHGFEHSDDYSKLSEEETYNLLKKAKTALEKISGQKIIGFRAPRLQKINFCVLKKLGIKYDSSLLPTYIPLSRTYTLGRFTNLFKKRSVFMQNNVLEAPITVIPFFKIPFLWITFRNLPLWYNKFCTKFSLINNNFINLFFHPWEFVDISSFDLPFLVKNKTGLELERKLSNYLRWTNLKPVTIKEFIEKEKRN